MKKLQKIFDKSQKNYADTRELDYKKAVYNNLDKDELHHCDECGREFPIGELQSSTYTHPSLNSTKYYIEFISNPKYCDKCWDEKIHGGFDEKDDLHGLKVLFYDASKQLNEVYTANNPYGDSLTFKRFEGYLNDPKFLTITTVDEMMGYLSNLPGVYPTWYDSIKEKDLNYKYTLTFTENKKQKEIKIFTKSDKEALKIAESKQGKQTSENIYNIKQDWIDGKAQTEPTFDSIKMSDTIADEISYLEEQIQKLDELIEITEDDTEIDRLLNKQERLINQLSNLRNAYINSQ